MVGMESAIVTGMLNILANKLAPLVIKEYGSIVGVKRDLEELQDLVKEIDRQLGTVGYRGTGDAPWLKKLKEVVYDIDDIVDEFQLKAAKHEIDGDGGFMAKCLLTEKAESLVLQCRAAKKIKKIKKRFAKIVKQRNDVTAICGNDTVSHINKTTMNRRTLPVSDEATVLGRNQEMHQIISYLVGNNDQNEIKILSIVGLGGSGKTTLAKLVFNDGETIKNHFDVKLWVHVSQEFDFEKIVKKLFEAFGDKDPVQASWTYMSQRIEKGLSQKKFLVVMDDVWTESQDQWNRIMGYLKAGAPGSGVLLTTRSANVAEVVRSTHQFCLQRLSPDDSWQLFQQSLMPAQFLESDFIKAGKEIVETCCGLPLAIKVLAGSLGGKDQIEEWYAMRDILLDVQGEDSVSASLKLSYFHLASNLKQCFTICSLFPKGHLINKQQLIDLWIAHDMISLTPGVDDLENIGLRYINSLVQVYFLQDVDEYLYGEGTYMMHDLIHDLARSILCDEISTVVPEDATNSTKGYRLFSLTEPRKLFPRKATENARAIYVDKGNDILFGSTLKNAKRLRSIIIENSILSTPVLTAIFEIKNLKYLQMPNLQIEALPEAITDVWSLQALYLQLGNLLELPKSIGKLKKLRTLNLSECYELKTLPESIGDCQMLSTLHLEYCDLVELPGSIGKLKKLRTLNLSKCQKLKTLPDSIGDCQMLSTFKLDCCKAFEDLSDSISRNKRLRVLTLVYTRVRRLPSGITTLENLEYLRIKLCDELKRLPDGIENLTKLKELDIDEYVNLPSGIGQLTQLEKLNYFLVRTDKKFARISELGTLSRISGELRICFLRNLTDPSEASQACLKQKEKLHELELSWGFRYGRENPEHEEVALDGLEPPLGIKWLNISEYAGARFASWMLKQASGVVQGHGPFPFLTKMILDDFPNLKNLDGLVHLPCLEVLHLVDMPAVESISGGPFPSLAKVKLVGLGSLGKVCIVTQGEGCSNHNHHQPGKLQIGSRLTYLHIEDCPKLVVKPHFPISLEHLWLKKSNKNLLVSPWQGQESSSSSKSPPSFSHLKELQIWCIKMGAPLPLSGPPSPGLRWEPLPRMSALESLEIFLSSGLTKLPELLENLFTPKFRISKISEPPSPGLRLELLQHMSALESLEIFLCSGLIELPEFLGNLCTLKRMTIENCDCLRGLPKSTGQLTSLQELIVQECDAFVQFPESLGELRSLHRFKICKLRVLTCFPESLCHLTSLKELSIRRCDVLVQLPEGLGKLCSLSKLDIWNLPQLTCLPQSFGSLMSLQELHLEWCRALCELPESLGELHRLRKLTIWGLDSITCLPQSLSRLTTSLCELEILICPGLKAMPEWIKDLTALQRLEIFHCPDLERRCERGNGEDWHLISHIPNLQIGEP